MKEIALTVIKPPATYIRGGHDENHVKDLRDVMTASDKSWPFDTPLVVVKLAKPEKVPVTMAGKPGTAEYELVDGYHRCMALVAEKVTAGMAEIRDAAKPDVIYFAQYEENQHGALKLDRTARARFIKTLREVYKWKLEQIASKMKLSEASVSRIARDLQTVEPGKPRKARGKKGKRNGSKPFTTNEFFVALGDVVGIFNQYRESILSARNQIDPVMLAGAGDMIEALTE
jgi:hypothetical protein